MDIPNKPQLCLDPSRVFCPVHGEPLRRMWPKGYAIFVLELFLTVMEDEGFCTECRLIDNKLPLDELPAVEVLPDDVPLEAPQAIAGEYRAMQMALEEKPLCCRVAAISPARLAEIYGLADIGHTARCAKCRQVRPGTPYQYKNHWGRVKRLPHLCFQCVAGVKDA